MNNGVIAIQLGNFKVNSDKTFEKISSNDSAKGIVMAIQPFLIPMSDGYHMLDTGIEAITPDGENLLLNNLDKAGVKPQDIRAIYISHLHKDHVGGLSYLENKKRVFPFENAVIYIHKKAYEFAISQTAHSSYDNEALQRLKTLSNVCWLSEIQGAITDEVSYLVTSGHTPYHLVFWFRLENEIVFFGGDDLPTEGYFKKNIAYKIDFDGVKAKDLRKKWKENAIQENWTVLFYHDFQNPVVKY